MTGSRGYRTFEIRMEVLERLGGKCMVCGFEDARALQIDHIAGDGCVDTNKIRDLYKMPEEELKSRYQVLCANHNWIKRNENGETRPMEKRNIIERLHPMDPYNLKQVHYFLSEMSPCDSFGLYDFTNVCSLNTRRAWQWLSFLITNDYIEKGSFNTFYRTKKEISLEFLEETSMAAEKAEQKRLYGL